MLRIHSRCPTGDLFSPQAKRDFKPPRPLCQARQVLTRPAALALPGLPNISTDSALAVGPESDERLGGSVALEPQNFADEIAAPFTGKLLKEKRLANALLFAEMSTAVSGEKAL
jgi:hypothetical protein